MKIEKVRSEISLSRLFVVLDLAAVVVVVIVVVVVGGSLKKVGSNTMLKSTQGNGLTIVFQFYR